VGAGQYRVGYHTVFADGRELSGQLTFTVGAAAPGTDTGDNADTADTGGVQADQQPPAAAHAHGAADPVTLGILALDVAALVVGLVVVLRGRRAARAR